LAADDMVCDAIGSGRLAELFRGGLFNHFDNGKVKYNKKNQLPIRK
jgi:hypothetical protein